jgi:molecular chaperone HtpG
MLAKKTLEINPHHSVMKEMLAKLKESSDEKLDEPTEDMARLMFHMALLNSGFSIEDPSAFTGPLQKLINVGFGLDREAPIEEIEVEIEEEEEKKDESASKPDDEEINVDDLQVEDENKESEPAGESESSETSETKEEL